MDITKPLAYRMMPKTLEEYVGQEHILGKDKILYRTIKADRLSSIILFGPPGCGKTSLAKVISNTTKNKFYRINAVTSGVAEIKKVVEETQNLLLNPTGKSILFIDEIHRFNKLQQDALLPFVENGTIILIGATTENPYFEVNKALISRSMVCKLEPLSIDDVFKVLKNSLESEDGLKSFNVKIEDSTLRKIAETASGDVRNALNSLELASRTTEKNSKGKIVIDLSVAEQSIQKKAMSIDETQYYDLLSAFCKSLRGSDTDAALYYSQRLILAGCDPMLIARRLVAHSSEDVGMADSNAMLLATSAMYAVEKMGAPEGLIPLSHAIIYVCEAEKSNSVVLAMNRAKEDAEYVKDDDVPNHLKNHPSINGPKVSYKYPHDYGGYVKQQYLPNALKNRIYYEPSANGKEKNIIRKKFKEN